MNIRGFILSFAVLLASVTAEAVNGDLGGISPKPQSIEVLKGSFKAVGSPMNCDSSLDDECLTAIRSFANRLSLTSGKVSSFATSVGLASAAEKSQVKGFVFINDPSVHPEGYSLNIGPKSTIVRISGLNGLLYAIETLKQLLPEAVYGSSASPGSDWHIPCAVIKDEPHFASRGIMLDCSRHFFSIVEIRSVLARMAACKMNTFHWHLTDDQGWRIEIRKYPELTLIGGYRDGTVTGDGSSDRVRYGGYYTQAQIMNIVEYAASLGIEIIPEISLSGHIQAAIASLPWLGDSEEAVKVAENWDASSFGLRTDKQESFEFIENVLTEVMYLFPSSAIHVGGMDSQLSGQQQEELFSRIEAFLQTGGRKMVRWEHSPSVLAAPVVGLADAMSDVSPQTSWIDALIWSEHIASDDELETQILPMLPAAGELMWNGQ